MKPAPQKMDVIGVALLAAGLGAVVQGSHEFLQYIVASGPQEPIALLLAHVVLFSMVTTALLTGLATACNAVFSIQQRTRQGLGEIPWHLGDFIFAGALLTIPLVLAHEALCFRSGRWPFAIAFPSDPFSHTIRELAIAAPCGELIFRTVAKIRGWDLSRAGGTQHRSS